MPRAPGDVIREALETLCDRATFEGAANVNGVPVVPVDAKAEAIEEAHRAGLAALRQLEADNVSLRALVEGESNTIDERDDAWTELASLRARIAELEEALAEAVAEIKQLKPHDHTWENRRVNDTIGVRPVCSECGVIRASFYMDSGATDA